jgi:hypothetical protein
LARSRQSLDVETGLCLDPRKLGAAQRSAELAVAGAVASQQAHAIAVGQFDIAADDGMDAKPPGRVDEFDGSIEAASVTEAKSGDAEVGHGSNQGRGRGCAFKE